MDKRRILLGKVIQTLGLGVESIDLYIAIQRIVYLLQLGGVHIGYKFHWSARGPANLQIVDDAISLQGYNLDGWTLDPKSIDKCKLFKPLFDRPTHEVIVLASIAFLFQTGQAEDPYRAWQVLRKNIADKTYKGTTPVFDVATSKVQQFAELLERFGLIQFSNKYVIPRTSDGLHARARTLAAIASNTIGCRQDFHRIVWWLQMKDFPLDYSFRVFFGGPYSDGLQGELQEAVSVHWIEETQTDYGIRLTSDSKPLAPGWTKMIQWLSSMEKDELTRRCLQYWKNGHD